MRRMPRWVWGVMWVWVAATASAKSPPNVVMIISDDQAWTDYGFMGHPHIQTPALDKLAAQSLTFTRGYVPDSLCRPSLATMATGLYPHQHRIVGNDPPGKRELSKADYLQNRIKYLDHITDVPTLPRMLQPLGYLSHQSGKWWEGSYQHGGFTHGMTHGDRTKGGRHGDLGLKIGRQGMKEVFDFIDMATTEDKPFFIWYAPFMPHTPHTPPKELFEKYMKVAPSESVAKYWAMCEWFDQTCGQLLDYLDEKKVSDNTLVVYICDNGWIQDPKANNYAPKSKRSQYDGGTRTPIMFRWPGHIEPKMDMTHLCSEVDLAPTILAACGLKPTPQMQGLNVMDSAAVDARKAIFGEILEHDIVDMNEPSPSLKWRWVIDGDMKLIVPYTERDAMKSAPVELYNLTADPLEEDNLAKDKPELVKQLTAKLDAWWKP
ncbi:MAG: sulfatase-like hydrolase/transferase [Phycisphaera sp.]|nr:sulfatase-like hydrolase/transferase [Phycisphaera sp.]